MAHSNGFIFLLFITTSILIITIPNVYGQKAPNATARVTTAAQPDPSCKDLYNGPNLWSHVYGVSGASPRLISKNPDCITVKGTVLSISKPGTQGADPDGDYHFNILANTPSHSNSHNCNTKPPPGKQCQELIIEIICFNHSSTVMTLPAAQASCKGYQNQIHGPKVGDSVTITGKWVEDYGVPSDHQYWNEIHPVTKIT